MKDITNYLEKPHVDAMLQVAALRSTRDYLMLRVLWRTGVRVDELRHIRPRDIEPHNKVVNVVKAKGGKMRRVPLEADTISKLQDYALTNDINENTPLFPLSKQWIRDLVHRCGMLRALLTSTRIRSGIVSLSIVCGIVSIFDACSKF